MGQLCRMRPPCTSLLDLLLRGLHRIACNSSSALAILIGKYFAVWHVRTSIDVWAIIRLTCSTIQGAHLSLLWCRRLHSHFPQNSRQWNCRMSSNGSHHALASIPVRYPVRKRAEDKLLETAWSMGIEIDVPVWRHMQLTAGWPDHLSAEYWQHPVA